MVSTQGEIRIGPLHQARLPEYRPGSLTELPPDPEFQKDREELRWMPGMTLDGDLLMYLRAARSMAAFAGMCDGGSADDGCIAASRDDTTINALDVLHDSTYDPGKALQALVKCPVPKGIEKKWCEDETKRFVKGLRQFGKNFFRIKKDLLPHKDTPELVEFYYLWKKTPGANNNRPHRRRRQGSMRRSRSTRNSPRATTPKEDSTGEGDDSGSDDDNSEDDSDSRDNGNFRCQHCFSTNSREFQHSGPKDRILLCAECRAYYKKYGELPSNTANNNNGSVKETPYLFRPVQTESPDGSPGRMRTRNKAKETPTKNNGGRPKRSSGTSTPDNEIDKKGAKSPGASSTCSNSPSDKTKKKLKVDTPTKSNRKRGAEEAEEEVSLFKKKRERADSPSESLTTDSGSLGDDGDQGSEDHQEAAEGSNDSPTPAIASNSGSQEGESKPDGLLLADECSNASLPMQPEELPMFESSMKDNLEIKQEDDETQAPPPVLIPEEKKAPSPLPDRKKEEVFSLSVLHGGQIPKSFEDIPSPGKITVKKESLFEPAIEPSVVMPATIETFMPKEEPNTEEGNEVPPEPAPVQSVGAPEETPAAVKQEPPEESSQNGGPPPSTSQEKMEDEPSPTSEEKGHSQPSTSDANVSPLPLTVYPQPSSPSQPGKSSPSQAILVPAYPPPMDSEKGPLNMSGPQHPFSPYYHPHFHPKVNPSPPYYGQSLQSEPQNLKIKQEVLPLDASGPASSVDPLQSLKEVKVPGYSPTSVSQPLLPTTSSSMVSSVDRGSPSSPFLGPAVDNIKKEPEYGAAPSSKSPLPRIASSPPVSAAHTPPFQPPPPPSSTAPTPSQQPPTGLIAPSPTHPPPPPSQRSSPLSRVSPAAHLSHPHAFVPTVHPHPHHLIHHPLFAAAAHAAVHNPYHHHPYAPYPYPFPYAPYPIPQPIPPPSSRESKALDSSTTIMTSHHSSSSVTTRSLREESRDDPQGSQEITQTHHHSSHHSSSSTLHRHGEGEKPVSISHSSSSSSSSSVQHKITSSKSNSSPATHHVPPSAATHVSATVSQTTSSSLSTNHGQGLHSHHHMHSHLHLHQSSDRHSPTPTSSLMPSSSRSSGSSSSKSGSNNSLSSVLPPHPLPLTGGGTSSLDALRAHAQAAALTSPLPLQPPHGLYVGSSDLLKSEPITVSSDEAGGAGDEEEVPSPTHHIPRGPSPEPKIEDTECHRSQSAIFLRHWNRGDYNSCTRTDLTFKPVPDSKLARKREERMRKQAEKEREEREKVHARKIATPEKPESTKPPSRGPIESISSPYDRFNPRSGYPDTPALRQLSEYARPHAGFSPVTSSLQRSAALGIPPQCIDPMLHAWYAPGARERLELEQLEREKREREIRELRERELNDRLKEEIMKNSAAAAAGAQGRIANALDPHWLDLHRRYPGFPSGAGAPPGIQFGLYPSPGAPGQPPLSQLDRDRIERLGAAGAYQRGGILSREAALGLHHPSDLLVSRPYADQLAHQAHEHLQRQILLERERFPHPLVAQHDEFLRQRERELKVRALEEASRGGSRP